MATSCFVFVLLALATLEMTSGARELLEPKTNKAVPSVVAGATLTDQKNVVNFGGVGSYSGIGNNGMPFGGLGGAIGTGGDLGGVSGLGGVGGGVNIGGAGGGGFPGVGGFPVVGGGVGGFPGGVGGAVGGGGGLPTIGGGVGAFPAVGGGVGTP